MSATIRRYDTVLFAGDSLTQFGWMLVAGGFVDQVNALIGTTQVGDCRAYLPGSGAFPTVAGVKAKVKGGAITVINRGIVGWGSAQTLADSSVVVSLQPNVIVLDIGINDATLGVTPAAYRSNLDATLDAYQAGITGVQILFVSPFLHGEQWTSVGPALNNSFDAATDAIVTQAIASCAAHSVPFVALRPDALTYEIANNTPEPGATFGVLMDSSLVHPLPVGQLFMSNHAMAQVTVVP